MKTKSVVKIGTMVESGAVFSGTNLQIIDGVSHDYYFEAGM